MRESLDSYCKRTKRPGLLAEWDPQRNQPLTPAQISFGSKRRVWWRCQHGHTWQAAVYTRAGSGSGCPVCAGKRPWPGENDLATLYPALARQWHPTKNEALLPEHVLPGSHRWVWWVCEKGHEWCAQIKSRTAGAGCPVCANRMLYPAENDFATRFPLLAAQWHPTKNGALLPGQLSPGSRRKVWWVCEKGHEWQATLFSRTAGGTGCPVCAGKKVVPGENDLASRFPALAAQWHPTKNGSLTPQQITPCSNRKVWWRCELGHDYQACVSSRTTNGSSCPYCTGRKVLPGFNDLATLAPELARQWHPTLNGTLTPDMVTTGSRRKVWWQCDQGHVWKSVIYSRAGPRQCGCPVCAGRVRTIQRQFYGRSPALVQTKEAVQRDW